VLKSIQEKKVSRTTRKLKRRVKLLEIRAEAQSELLHIARQDILHQARLIKENTAYLNMLLEIKDNDNIAAMLIREGVMSEPQDKTKETSQGTPQA